MSNNIDISQLSIDRSVNKSARVTGRKPLVIIFALICTITGFSIYITDAKTQDLSQVNTSLSVIDSTSDDKGVALAQASLSQKTSQQNTPQQSERSQGRLGQTGSSSGIVLDASGHIVARRIATVSSRVTGKLTQLHIEEGQKVTKAQVLAELDEQQANISYQLALADLSAQQASFHELEIVYQHELKRLQRRLALHEKSLISEQLLDDTRLNNQKLNAQLNNKRALIALSEQKVALAKYQLSQHKIRAPFDGVVISKNAQVGELISAGTSGGGFIRTGVGTLVDMSSLEIEVDVSESYINRVYQGQRTMAVLDAYPQWQIPSEVVAVIPTADRQKASIKVRIKLHQITDKILPDMGVKVSFLASSSQQDGNSQQQGA